MLNTYEKIKSLRIQKRLSQDDLARLTGYTDRSSIAKIEAGKVDLTESKILLFSKALDVSPSYLMGLMDEAPAAPAITLTADETQLVEDYRSLNPEGQTAARTMLAGLTAQPIYKKHHDPAELLGV